MQRNYKKALLLEYITIAWNLFEGVTCISIGLFIKSVSLFAYGLESSIEIFSSSVVVWDLKTNNRKTQDMVLKLIGLAYLLASAYIFIDAVQALFSSTHIQKTTLGIFMTTVSALVMVYLGIAKNKIGKKIKSPTVLADAKFTLIDAALSVTVLIGLVFDTFFGWWWMDQAIALFLSGVAFREGLRELL